MAYGKAVIAIGPVLGCAFIIISRFLAAQIRFFAALVANTKEMANNSKK